VDEVKHENEETEAWLVSDAKALGIITQGVEPQYQTKIRSATRVMQAWNTLRVYYNRVTMTGRLHEFKMENGSTMSKHLDAFDLPVEYALENAQDVTLKQNIQKKYEPLEKKETTERAFKVNAGQLKGHRAYGHLRRDCPEQNGASGNYEEISMSEGQPVEWLIDSGATAHMTPHRADLFEYETLDTGIEVTIADGKKLRVVGRGTVRLTGLDSVRIMMEELLYIPGLDRWLLAIALGKKADKAYLLDCQQEETWFVQYAGVGSEWDLWHARMGHPNENALVKTQLGTTGIPTV
ncbi:polyprotein, partial [Phytophthora megakarya]